MGTKQLQLKDGGLQIKGKKILEGNMVQHVYLGVHFNSIIYNKVIWGQSNFYKSNTAL